MKTAPGLLLAFFALALLLVACGAEEERAVTALAMNDDPEAAVQAVLYLGNPEKHAFQLPQGEYSVLAMDQDSNLVEVHASLPSDGVIPLDKIVFGTSATKEEREANKENVGKLLEFFAANDYSVLSYMERVLRTGGDLGYDDMAAQFDDMAQLRASLERAIEGLEHFSEALSARRASPSYVMAPTLSTLPAPAAGKVGLLSEWWKWAKTLVGGAEDARQKILEGMAALPDDRHRQLLLDKMRPQDRRAWDVPDNASDFLKKLKDGDLDYNALQIHNALCEGSGSVDPADPLDLANYLNHAQNTNSRSIDLAHKHGKSMVEQGTKFNMAVWKEMIAAAKGGEKAKEFLNTAIDKANLIYDLTQKPGETLTKEGLKQVLENELKTFLLGIGVPEGEVGDVIGLLADEVYSAGQAGWQAAAGAATPTPIAEAVLSMPTPSAPPSPEPSPQVTPAPTLAPSPTVAPTPTPSPEATPTPEETATVAPDTGWIEGYVQGIANQWLDKGYGGIDVAVAADDLRGCLTDAVVGLGLSQEEAIADCPVWLFEPSLTPEPTETPEPQPTETLTPPTGNVTAVGQLLGFGPETVVAENIFTLRFNTGGGSVDGEGHIRIVGDDEGCGPNQRVFTYHFEGTYSSGSKTFSGTVEMQIEGTNYFFNWEGVCRSKQWTESYSWTWQATLEDGVVRGQIGEMGLFELTVQGS